MEILALTIEGFRGIRRADIRLDDHTAIIGPNSSGKSTIIDALSLVFGRSRLVRELTEHDFCGSCPTATCRIRIIATLGGFGGNDPNTHYDWFREGRAVPKWWNPKTGQAEPDRSAQASELCAQIAFAARFDLEELAVEQIRYFHDDDGIEDVFQEDGVQQFPGRLFNDIGYYVLPVRRTWEATVSFASELFRKAVATVGGIPAGTILDERDRLRHPEYPLETDKRLGPLVQRINSHMAQLLPQAPQLQLRVTSTDSESLLRALVPHYETANGVALPAGRHGTGLLSLQTFILLLEIGRERRQQGLSFILAMEEPELHVPPGLQRRLIAQAVSIADQTICTSHTPRIAAFFPATKVQFLERKEGRLSSTPLLEKPLGGDATAAARKLYHDDRAKVVEALMHYRVLVPEGRNEYEWFRLLVDAVETGDRALTVGRTEVPPFGAVVGVVPTHGAAVKETYERLRKLRAGICAIVDGDRAGEDYIRSLTRLDASPDVIVQWPNDWKIESAICWVLEAGDDTMMDALKSRIENHEFDDLDGLKVLFDVNEGRGRLKTDYLAHEEIASVIREQEPCLARAEVLLGAVTLACLGRYRDSENLELDEELSTEASVVLRFQP
jgi:energy-coupling factor transporter ATP-binding protein EcfA2